MDKLASREFRRRIGRVLFEQWDPIGVRDEPAARDEYDGYVHGVFRLLLEGASEQQIARHLLIAERDAMELPGTTDAHRLAVAGALRALPLPPDASRHSAS
jgi:hypothetical protein